MRILGAFNGAFNGVVNASINYNSLFVPENFGPAVLGDNAIDPNLLLPTGVGDLSLVPGIENNTLDNRHISRALKEFLCMPEDESYPTVSLRDYFGTLIGLAWHSTTEFHLCCSQPAGVDATSPCQDPDFVFSSKTNSTEVEPLALAPHFLTSAFEKGQQEALTAGLIAKLNSKGERLYMDLGARFDLGPAGTKFITREDPENHPHFIGSAWGNMFLDCLGADSVDPLCEASMELDRYLGRDPEYYGAALFACLGESTYPTKKSGKTCFDPEGCDLVAMAGECDEVCVGGFCGVNLPPIQGRGSTNVISIYMADYN